MKCEQCGVNLLLDSIVCRNCGEELALSSPISAESPTGAVTRDEAKAWLSKKDTKLPQMYAHITLKHPLEQTEAAAQNAVKELKSYQKMLRTDELFRQPCIAARLRSVLLFIAFVRVDANATAAYVSAYATSKRRDVAERAVREVVRRMENALNNIT